MAFNPTEAIYVRRSPEAYKKAIKEEIVRLRAESPEKPTLPLAAAEASSADTQPVPPSLPDNEVTEVLVKPNSKVGCRVE